MSDTACVRLSFAVISAILFCASVVAAPLANHGALVTPSQAYKLALANDPNLDVSRARWISAKEQLVQAQATLMPQVSLSFSSHWNQLDRPLNDTNGSINVRSRYPSNNGAVQIRQTIYRKPATVSITIAELQEAEARWLHESEIQKVGLRVVQAYANGLAALQDVRMLTEQLSHTDVHIDAAQRRYASGVGIRTDIDEAIARQSELQAMLLQANMTRATSLSQLSRLIGQPVGALADLSLPEVPVKSREHVDFDQWAEKMQTGHFELQAWAARIRMAESGVTRAEAAYMPTLELIAQWVKSSAESVTLPDSRYMQQQVGLQFNMPLYAGGAHQSQVRLAEAEVDRVKASREAFVIQLKQQAERDWTTVVTGPVVLQAAQNALDAARQMEVAVTRSFEGGLRTTQEVLLAKSQRVRLQRNQSHHLIQWWLAWVQLKYLEGQLDEATFARMDTWTNNSPASAERMLPASVEQLPGSR